MKVWLSNGWRGNIITLAIMYVIVLIYLLYTSLKCNDIVFLFFALLIFVPYSIIISASLHLLRYVTQEDQLLVMRRFTKKIATAIALNAPTYYEIVMLIEGLGPKQEFIILSNTPFTPYKQQGYYQLSKVVKAVDKKENQVIMPYKGLRKFENLSINDWYNVSLRH